MTKLVPYREAYASEEAAADFKNVIMYGKTGIGSRYFFFRKLLTTYYLPFSEVVNAYRRVQLVSCGACTAGDHLNMQMVVVELKDGTSVVSDISGEKQAEIVIEAIKALGIPVKAPNREQA
ncbi:MAG: hypothetical protein PUA52_07730 [Lachnospiraceae bacterium]|nr:hypothetical protein [Lachnospiraceae bacterium]